MQNTGDMEQSIESLPMASIVDPQDLVLPILLPESTNEVVPAKQDLHPSIDAAPPTLYEETANIKQEHGETFIHEGEGDCFDNSKTLDNVDSFELADHKPENPDQNYTPGELPCIPTFDKLEREGAIKLKDPTPGYLQFPGAFNLDGTRNSIKDVFASRAWDVLPPAYEPLWKQMLSYCQRWSVWVATVENDQRRSELTQWVTKKMQEAWDFGITNGHCGEPNGHKYCCLAHAPNGEDDQKAKQQKETRKKNVDQGKQAAPFSNDGNKHSYAIINRELDRAKISMETVMDRVTSENIEAGNELLDEMCERLGRDALEQQDWTVVSKYGKFDPRIHSRNLLMFCLWEVQRCRNVVVNSKINLSKASTSFQQKNLQKRIDTNQQRADQHLVLALILEEQRGEETNEDDEESSKPPIEEEVVTRPRRRTNPFPPVQIISEKNNEDDDAYMASDESKEVHTPESPESPDLANDAMSHNGSPSFNITDHSSSKHDNDDNTALELGLYLPIEMEVNREDSSLPRIGDKRGLAGNDTDDEPETKKFKFEDRPFDTIQEDESENEIRFYDTDPNPESRSDVMHAEGSTSPSPVSRDEGTVPTEFIKSLHEHAIADDNTQELTQNDSLNTKRPKQEYIVQCWQPRINALLAQHGREPLNWPLGSWQDIRHTLDKLGFNAEGRNQVLRDFKAGFNEWSQPMKQQAPQQNQHLPTIAPQNRTTSQVPTSIAAQQGSTSIIPPESTRGFFFRYHPFITTDEQEHVDEMIQEYVATIMHTRTNRFGFYAVFITPGDTSQKELAHGIWELQKHRKPEDAEWFFQGQPKPTNFRANEVPLYHEWGYSLAPPKRARSRKRTSKSHQIESTDDEYKISHNRDSHGGVDHSRSKHSHNQNPKNTSASRHSGNVKTRVTYTGRIRKARRTDSDIDSEYQPEE